MSRDRFKNVSLPFPVFYTPERVGDPSYMEINTHHERIVDENHTKRWKGSNGPCYHSKFLWKPAYLTSTTATEGEIMSSPSNRHAGVLTDVAERLVSSTVSETVSKLRKEIYNEYARSYERFDLINAVAGLADVGSLFKRLGKYRYLDWEFGLAPTIADARIAYQRAFESTESVIAKVKSAHKPTRISRSRLVDISVNEEINYYADDPSQTLVSGHCTVRFKGRVATKMPLLTNFDRDWYLWLDKIGFHPDLATLWEAVPFSWLIDWFVPIGSSLESAVGDWFNPTVFMWGNLSYKALLDFQLKRPSPELFNNSTTPEGSGTSKIYSREVVNYNFDSRSISLPSVRLPVPHPKKCGILADIAGLLKNPIDPFVRTARRTRFNI